MGKWGSQFVNRVRKHNNNLGVQKAIEHLSPKARQAMIVAIEHKGNIAKGTWNGCAFNAAGQVIGNNAVSSYGSAAKAFDMSVKDVHQFIKHWDGSSVTTEELKRLLYNERLFEDEPVSKTYSVRVFTSEETRRREKFEAMVKGLDFENLVDEVQEELVSNAHTLSELISV